MIIREVTPGEGGDAEQRLIRVVLADKDPLSRQFLVTALGAVAGVEIEALDIDEIPATGDHQVVIVAGALDQPAHLTQLRSLTASGSKALVLGVNWTQRTIQDALEAGAFGVVIKTLDIDGLVAAVRAVASGHVVISPELLSVYLGTNPAPPARPDAFTPTGEALRLLTVLTAREIEVLGLLEQGLATVEVAEKLGVSLATVKSHVSHALAKLGVRNRVQAVLIIKDLRLVELAARTSTRTTRGTTSLS